MIKSGPRAFRKPNWLHQQKIIISHYCLDMYPINSCRASIILITCEFQGYQITITCMLFTQIILPSFQWGFIFSQVYSLYFFLKFAHLWWFWVLGFWGWGLGLGFWGWGIQLMWFGACGLGPSGLLGVVALYINIKE